MNFRDKYAKCPFYKSAKETSLKCEGIFSKSYVNDFDDKEKTRAYFFKYCCSDYKNCPIAKIIEKKYNFEVT